jgi:hypothetical protein
MSFQYDAKSRNLAEIFSLNVRRFFAIPETAWVAAEVYNDLAEWFSLPKATMQILLETVTSDIVQESYQLYLGGSIGFGCFSSMAYLAITLAESEAEKLLDSVTPLTSKILETMLFLLNSEISSRTFNFWISFAEASIDIGDGHPGDPWLKRALLVLLQISSWREDADQEEWSGYRIDVVEVFEGICEVLDYETINSIVATWLEAAVRREDTQEKIVVFQLP